MTAKRVVVCGGRAFNDFELAYSIIKQLPAEHIIVHGAARGADRIAGQCARELNRVVEEYPADWDRFGKSAGFRRNDQMLNLPNVVGVVAFEGGKGTAHTMRTATAMGIPVQRVKVVAAEGVSG